MTLFDYRDPLYGFITVDNVEQKIIDSVPFQRLRRIAQLGPTNLVYPTANHTRFEHSLGTLQASTEMFNRLLDKKVSRESLGWDKDQIEQGQRSLRLAALLHDVGHAPYSHATEELFSGGLQHEDYTYRIITETEIGECIDSAFEKDFKIRVAEIATGKAKRVEDSFISELLTGDIGSDRIDYLLRDSYHLGVSYGSFDRHRLFNTLFIRDNPEKGGPELAIEEGGLHAVEGFLLARYFMFLDVYFHKTRRILDIHLTEFLKGLLQGGAFPQGISDFIKMDDVFVTQSLMGSNSAPAEMLKNRTFFRLSFDTTDHPQKEELVAFKWLLEQVRDKFGVSNLRIDEAEKAPYKYSRPPIFVRTDEGDKSLSQHSPLVRSLNIIRKKRIYANENIRDQVREFAMEQWNRILSDVPK